MADIKVSGVPKEYIHLIEAQVLPLLNKVEKFSDRRWEGAELLEECKKGDFQLWIAFEDTDDILSAVVTQFRKYPREYALEYVFVGGKEMKKWYTPMSELLHRYAKDHGCKRIETFGRKGWHAWHTKHGFKETHVVYSKVID